MAYNDISKNYTYENGGTIDGDLALTTMAANTKIKNKASGQLYAKRSGYTNVFDKTNTYANYLKADEFGIINSGSGNGVASITYSTSGRKITQNLTTFTTPSDLATANDNLKSQAVGSITVSGRTVTYKNVNGQTLGSFQTQDNNTTYSAGTGLSLNGTQFNVNIPNYKVSDGTNPDATYIMTLDISQNACHPSQYTIGSLIDYINTHNTTYSAGTGLSLSGTTFNVTSTAGNSNLQWNTEITLGTVGGLAIKAKLPANPVSGEDSSGNGWVRFKNGVQICGQICSSQVKDFAVNFPMAFTSVWSVTITNNGYSADTHVYGKVDGVGTSSFAIHTNSNDTAWYWMAIGFWK